MLGVYWTHGPYDIVIISEWPDKELASAVGLGALQTGNAHVISMRAFNAEEMQRIIDKIP